MLNKEYWEKHYKANGYKCLGWANINEDAQKANSESINKQVHEIGKNLHLVACVDLKVYFMVDSGD